MTSLQDYDYSYTQGMGDQSKFGSRQMESTAGGMRSSVGIYKERLDSPAGGTSGGMVAPKSKGKDLFFQNNFFLFEFEIYTTLRLIFTSRSIANRIQDCVVVTFRKVVGRPILLTEQKHANTDYVILRYIDIFTDKSHT